MKLSASDLAYVCWALEEAPIESPEEEERIGSLLSLLSREVPYAPFSSSSQWRASLY